MCMSRRAVVITGIGPISAFGMGIEPLWQAMLEGRSKIRPIEAFDASTFSCPVAAELSPDEFRIRDIVPRSYRKATKVMARDIQLAVGAALAGVKDAGLVTKGIDPDQEPTINPDRFGCHIGAGLVAADVDELTSALAVSTDENGVFDLADWGHHGINNLTPLWLLKYLPNMLACHVTIIHDCRGPSNTITCAEASSALSLGESLRVIQREQADACLTGGAECKVNPMGMLRQHFAKRLIEVKDAADLSAIVKPFDREACGTVLGEGGGILVVEARDIAQERGARIYCEVAGFASSQSFCPDTIGLELDADDEGMTAAIENALADADLPPDEIDAIAPFASGIPNSDQAEAGAIRRVFGDRAKEIPIITTVPNVGNCCAGSGAITLSIAAKALFEQTLPARINALNTDGLDANAVESRPAALRHILVCTTSMGGQNAAVVLRRTE